MLMELVGRRKCIRGIRRRLGYRRTARDTAEQGLEYKKSGERPGLWPREQRRPRVLGVKDEEGWGTPQIRSAAPEERIKFGATALGAAPRTRRSWGNGCGRTPNTG
ncbi:hypothetical protein C8J57DRAFT_1230186 [Mycena rebaudengoi]|nr:hypothetical protein C8J57DRAFT_1230186 [Mycena rebaudengoi]